MLVIITASTQLFVCVCVCVVVFGQEKKTPPHSTHVLSVPGEVGKLHHLISKLAENLHKLLEGADSFQMVQGNQDLMDMTRWGHYVHYVPLHNMNKNKYFYSISDRPTLPITVQCKAVISVKPQE